jgi:hypothetical protein
MPNLGQAGCGADVFRGLVTQHRVNQFMERFHGLAVAQIFRQRETDKMRSLSGRFDE